MIIHGRNVNELYRNGREYLATVGVSQASRAGAVLVAPSPVVSVYEKPTERVLFDPQRDANPFFHIAEGIWMLAGARDASFLDRFVKDFSSRFNEDWGGQHGAYGHRWRYYWEDDQLQIVIARLRRDHYDRRVVLAMWDAAGDLRNIEDPENVEPKDIPCNTHIYPRVREGLLDITVCCRSNDAIWGCYGANAVHFSMLQEYLAAGIGVGVGRLYQLSNNWHGYRDVLDKKPVPVESTNYYEPYGAREIVSPQPMVTDFKNFLADVACFMEAPEEVKKKDWYCNPWFYETLIPMVLAAKYHREKDREKAMYCATQVKATDWSLAAVQWLQRRYK